MMTAKTDYLFMPIQDVDTDSRVFGTGKAAALKTYDDSLHFREQTQIFYFPLTVHGIMVAGENALVSLYYRKPREKLDGILYQRHCKKLAGDSQFSNIVSQPACNICSHPASKSKGEPASKAM